MTNPVRGPDAFSRRGLAFVTTLVALGFTAGGVWVYAKHHPKNLPLLELAGSAEQIDDLIGAADVDVYASALNWDLALIACYVGAIAVAGFLGTKVFVSPTSSAIARLAIAFGVLAGLLGVAANRLLASVLPRLDAQGVDVLAQRSQGFGFAALVLLIVAAPVAAVAVGVAVWRFAYSFWPWRRAPIPDADVLCGAGDVPITDGPRAAWVANWRLPDTRKLGGAGVCVSGGGIRSATFALGALQAMQEAGRLGDVRYLVAVSGGGYAVGAMRLALQPAPARPVESLATPTTVFAMGSPEFDHLRRHSKYLADGVGQWLRALAVVLRGLLVAQFMLLLAFMLAARAVGEIYAAAPVLKDALTDPARLTPGVRWAMVVPFFGAMGLWVVGVVAENSRRLARLGEVLRPVAAALAYAGLAMVFVGLLVPLLVYASVPIRDQLPADTTGAEQAATGAATVLTAGYLSAIAGIFLTTGRVAGSVIRWAQKNRAVIGVVPALLLQRALVILGVLVLIAAQLFVFARVVYGTTKHTNEWPGSVAGWHFLLMAGVFVVLGLFVDQTRWSLHPFYKQQLARAFAVRRVRQGREPASEPYPRDEVTDLYRYCSWREGDGFPQVIFLTAANVSGQQVTPPGRKVLPYTMSGDWIGSPRLGWIKAESLAKAVRYPLRLDLTTQAAMAISGAAFASAMGASGAPYSLLFALTNARLGTWLPNPLFLYQHLTGARRANRWRHPPLPGWRRLHFLVREVFGVYPWDGQLLLLTDGGHYENLGLVELLRHAPDNVFCFDASGGESVTASALGPAIALAREELGVEIMFDERSPDERHNPVSLMPGSAEATAAKGQTSDPLAARLALSNVLVATIRYPDCRPPGAPADGRLYFGRAGLTPDTPWEVRAYASRHPTFPNDSTSDQWFNQEQFDAYHALGRHIGQSVIATAGEDPNGAGGKETVTAPDDRPMPDEPLLRTRQAPPAPSAPVQPSARAADGPDTPGFSEAAMQVLTAAEVAAVLRVPAPAVIAAIQDGRMPGNDINGEGRVRAAALVGWLDGLYGQRRTVPARRRRRAAQRSE